jgi:oxygen-dependent protoporphyrinogen oxidase
MSHVAVLGAGIAGLTTAHQLVQDGVDVTVLEASDCAGGVIQSTKAEGFRVEHGPNSLRPSPALGRLLADLDLLEAVVTANEVASTRYVVRDETPTALPMSPTDFITTDLFSTRAKWRLLGEPFVSRRAAETDESVADFVRRRLGPEVLDYAVAPFVGGVFAGRPEDLSVQHAFERLSTLEQKHGSLLWGGIRSALSGSDDETVGPSGLFSFRDGLHTLPAALHKALDDRVAVNAPVSGLAATDTGWVVSHGGTAPERFDAVVCTLPLHRFTALNFKTPVDCTPLREVSYPPLQVVALGYDRAAVSHPLDGFGMLVPPVEDAFDILGTLFSSTLFPNRAPEGRVLLTTFVGGARAPALAQQPDDAVQEVVERDLGRLLEVTGSPVFSQHIHWSHAIPQYTLGYGAAKDTLDALEGTHPGLVFAGNYRQGVSVGDAAASGADAAERVVSLVDQPTSTRPAASAS